MGEQKYRVQLDFSEAAFNELNRLQEELEASSRAEVVRHALATLRWFVSEVSKGNRILVQEGNGSRTIEIVAPFYIPIRREAR